MRTQGPTQALCCLAGGPSGPGGLALLVSKGWERRPARVPPSSPVWSSYVPAPTAPSPAYTWAACVTLGCKHRCLGHLCFELSAERTGVRSCPAARAGPGPRQMSSKPLLTTDNQVELQEGDQPGCRVSQWRSGPFLLPLITLIYCH